jgi:hypothetical protein
MESPPRRTLVPRFALTTLAVFVAVGVVLWWVLAATINERIESASEEHAEFVTHSVIAPALREFDLDRPVSPGHPGYERLEGLVASRILGVQFPVVGVKLWRSDGTILYSDQPGLAERRFLPSRGLRSALDGRVVSVPGGAPRPEGTFGGERTEAILVTYVPLAPAGPSDRPTGGGRDRHRHRGGGGVRGAAVPCGGDRAAGGAGRDLRCSAPPGPSSGSYASETEPEPDPERSSSRHPPGCGPKSGSSGVGSGVAVRCRCHRRSTT